MVEQGHRYFVRQTFERARDPFDETTRGHFLFCHYQEWPKAKEHYDVLAGDPFRRLYDWGDPADRERLLVAAGGPAGYRVFSNTFLPEWEQHVTPRLRQKMKAYVARLGWKPARDEQVAPVFFPYFGEVYVSLKFRRQEVRVKLEEIEKML